MQPSVWVSEVKCDGEAEYLVHCGSKSRKYCGISKRMRYIDIYSIGCDIFRCRIPSQYSDMRFPMLILRVADLHSSPATSSIMRMREMPVIYRHNTLSEYVKIFAQNGFYIRDMNEPIPTEEQTAKPLRIEWLKRIPMYLFMELKRL